MELKLKVYDALCATEIFEINGVDANSSDFGEKEDIEPEMAEPYGCGNMQFTPKPSTNNILQKYSITTDEYNQICEELSGKLSFGCCGWCV